ncbi:MAG: SlyX family protein [Pirellulaceae bacterium]|nr:SlyX family protein [Pirellulaceae bacterium]
MPDESAIEKRLTELEFQFAHQQRLYEQLNQVVVEHTQQILRLERTNLRLEDQIKILREQRKEAFDPGLEKPPHY